MYRLTTSQAAPIAPYLLLLCIETPHGATEDACACSHVQGVRSAVEHKQRGDARTRARGCCLYHHAKRRAPHVCKRKIIFPGFLKCEKKADLRGLEARKEEEEEKIKNLLPLFITCLEEESASRHIWHCQQGEGRWVGGGGRRQNKI